MSTFETSDFAYSPSEYVPFRDKAVLERMRDLGREDFENHPNPNLTVHVGVDFDMGLDLFGEENGISFIDIMAQSFLWQMVRRLVGATFSVESGERSIEDVERALKGEKIIFRIAPPEPLFLMSVEYTKVRFSDIEPKKLDSIRQEIEISERFIFYLSSETKETL